MTTLEVEIALMRHFKFNLKDIVVGLTNGCTLVHFETDMLILSNSGYATAVEIKVSKADLKKDNDKPHIKALHPDLETEFDNYKTWRIGTNPLAWYEKIKHFYYAVPEKLESAALEQIPPQCGLIVIRKGFPPIEVRKPKVLNQYKWSDGERMNLLRLGTMRQYNLKRQILKLKK